MRLLKASQIIIGDGTESFKNGGILIEDGRIKDVGYAKKLETKYQICEVEEFTGCTILPGLVDMHTHIGFWWTQPDASLLGRSNYDDFDIAYYASKKLKEALSLGVTTIRTVGDPKGLGRAIKRALNKGYLQGPRVVSCDRGICKTGGHVWQLKNGFIQADGPWGIRKAVREVIKTGADWIKVAASHESHICEYTQEELDAAVNECHRSGKKCCIHASTLPAIKAAISAGFDTLEHGTFISKHLAGLAKEKGIAWTPTLSITKYLAESVGKRYAAAKRPLTQDEKKRQHFFWSSRNELEKNLLYNYNTGIKMLAGTDVVIPGLPITPVAEEIKSMCDAGLNPLLAIRCATQSAAEVLGLDNKIGLIKKGLIADLLVVRGDPQKNIDMLKAVKKVFQNGVETHSNKKKIDLL